MPPKWEWKRNEWINKVMKVAEGESEHRATLEAAIKSNYIQDKGDQLRILCDNPFPDGSFKSQTRFKESEQRTKSRTSMTLVAPALRVLTMWTLGVEVERCLWRDWPSAPGMGKWKAEPGDSRPGLKGAQDRQGINQTTHKPTKSIQQPINHSTNQ